MTKDNKQKLKSGFTTGTAAAAAVKAALNYLLEGKPCSQVEIVLLNGSLIDIPIHNSTRLNENSATCSVIKDAGDDPDITHKAQIGAIVRLAEPLDNGNRDQVVITGGKGIGRVTKPGLVVAPGEPAINPGPRKMIIQAVKDVLNQYEMDRSVQVEIFAPEGENLAKKTLNARLGILGGISILGTTGVVKPMSHEAYIATIESSLSVAHAAGLDCVVLTTGRRSEKYAQAYMDTLPDEAFIQIGDFFKQSLQAATDQGFGFITLAVFFGKALKMAQGIPHTHAANARLTLQDLANWSLEITKDNIFAKKIKSANTARHAFNSICKQYPMIIPYVGRLIINSAKWFAGENTNIRSIIFDYDGNVIFDSDTK
ncbi:MAG: cobalt-precorrin-5B (C(1))-methyltransferase [Desulfobacterales bacterium]|nr:cobalt-precorrin-5B (C(1))-methyltransferase [Desulfobacterales bacterium]